MRLLEIWLADNDLSYDLYKSFEKDENGFINSCFEMNREEYDEYVLKCYKNSLGQDLKPGYVPDSKYVVIDDEDNYVGIVNFRHYLNDALRNGAGHIGYIIRKEYRNKGYAKKALALALEKCKDANIHEVYLSCNMDNIASLKVQLANGAIIHHQDDKCNYTRIFI